MFVAIIGGAGKMGRLFARYFLEQGHEVAISDIRVDKAREFAESMNIKLVDSNVEAVRRADLVLLSTPIDVTPKVLAEIKPGLSERTIVAEITSLKSKVFPVLKDIAKSGVRTLSLHPLFGSGVLKLTGEKIALVPVVNLVLEETLAREIFPDVNIIPVDRELHDRIMALTLALTHFVNIAFASVIGEEDIKMLKRLGGTTFTLQIVISEAVMHEDPALYASVQMDNDNTIKYLNKFMLKAADLKNIIEKNDTGSFIEFYRNTRELISRDEDFRSAYEKMYRALKAIQAT